MDDEDEQWADWLCERCSQKLLVIPGADPNADAKLWRIQGMSTCDREIVKQVMKS